MGRLMSVILPRFVRGWRCLALALIVGVPVAPALADDSALVGQIAQVLGQHQGVRADFTQTQTLAALKQPAVSHGTLLFASRQGVLWQVDTPYRTTYVFRDQQVIEIDANGRRSVRDSRDAAGMRQVTQLRRAAPRPNGACSCCPTSRNWRKQSKASACPAASSCKACSSIWPAGTRCIWTLPIVSRWIR